ncbi:MAG: hypothetical protein JWM07_766 [Candidatus Saccharibacteria bacterium]|nr:hypothetical protein [Candidatus Saccharibacteria bacterium]
MTRSYGKTFVGDTQSAALAQPFVMAPSPHRKGILLAKELWFGFPIYMDPYTAKTEQGAPSKRYVLSGQLDAGKTATMKAIARRVANLQAFDDPEQEEPVESRMLIHDRKMNEYYKYTEAMHGTIIEMGGAEKFNPFDYALVKSVVHMVDIAVNLCEVVKKKPMEGFEPTVIAIGVYLMLNNSFRRPSIEHLEYVVMNMTVDQVTEYYQSNSLLDAIHKDPGIAPTMEQRMQPIANVYIGNMSWTELRFVAGKVAGYLGQVTRGVLGAVFGGEASMYDKLTSRCSTIMWRDTNLEAQDAAEAVFAKWRTIARHDKSLIKMVPHQIISDETGKALARSAISLRFMSEDARDDRALHTATYVATQYEGDITSAGGSDPNLHNMAQAINNATAGRIIFNQPDTEDNTAALKRYGFEDLDIERVAVLPQGCAAFKMPNQPPVFGRVLLTDTDKRTSYSNMESDKMVRGRQQAILNNEEIARRAKKMGVSTEAFMPLQPIQK